MIKSFVKVPSNVFRRFLAVTPNVKSMFIGFLDELYGEMRFPRNGLLRNAKVTARIVRMKNTG